MREKKTVCKSVRLTPSQSAKTAELARQLGIAPNQLIGRLVDSAVIVSQPVVTVALTGADVERRNEVKYAS